MSLVWTISRHGANRDSGACIATTYIGINQLDSKRRAGGRSTDEFIGGIVACAHGNNAREQVMTTKKLIASVFHKNCLTMGLIKECIWKLVLT